MDHSAQTNTPLPTKTGGTLSPTMLLAHPDLDMEWWYYSGHLRSGDRRFGFCLSFFRAHTAGRDVAWPVRLAARITFPRQYYPAHFSLTDGAEQEFRYAHRRTVRGAAGAATDRYHVWSGDWSAREDNGVHCLTARMRGASLKLSLLPTAPPVGHGDQGRIEKNDSGPGHHFSHTRMQATGMLRLGRQWLDVVGTAWMDREFGGWRLFHRWDWIGIQLDDGRDLMVSLHRDPQGQPLASAFATLVDGGSVCPFSYDQFELCVRRTWRSPLTGAQYPVAWTLRIPSVGAELDIESVIDHQELDTRGSTMIIYWEGQARVSGQFGDRSANGSAYVELLGYDQSHLRVTFLDWIRGELLLHRYGPGRVVRAESAKPFRSTES